MSDQIRALVVALDEAIGGALAALGSDTSPRHEEALQGCLRAARATVAALASVLGMDEEPDPFLDRPATEDSDTCGHPETFDPPADNLCRSCGATRQADGSWSLM